MQLIDKGINYIRNGKIKEAIEIFELILNNRRGYSLGYYYLGICFYYLKDMKKSKQNWDKAISYGYIESFVDSEFNKFFENIKQEYKALFGIDAIKQIEKKNKCDKKVKKLFKLELKQIIFEIENCNSYSIKFLENVYKVLQIKKSEYIVNILGYMLKIKQNKEFLLEVADLLYDLQLYYLSGKIYDYLIEKYPKYYLPYIRIADSLKEINAKYDLAIEYLEKALKFNDNKEIYFNLIRLYRRKGDIYSVEQLMSDMFKKFGDEICEELIDMFYILDLKKNCKTILEKNISKIDRKITQLGLQIMYGYEEKAKNNFEYIKNILKYKNKTLPLDEDIKRKLEISENVVTFFTIGRGGSFFFHSLIDGHKEIATIPGVYFKGYFSSGVFQKSISSTPEEMVEKFMNIYEIVFDASSKKPVPGDPMDGKGATTIAEASGLTTLGENRDIVLKIDKEKFKQKLIEYLKRVKFVTEKTFFQLIHIAWEESIREHNFLNKKSIFYHIHNPTLIEFISFKMQFPFSKTIFMIRNWLQSLESWMYGSILFYKEGEWSYKIKWQKFEYFYTEAFLRIISRLFIIRNWLFVEKKVAFVKLEDVKNTPEPTMRAVANWMGIEYDESLLKPGFMGLKFHSNKSKLNPNISEFDKTSIKRKIGVLFSEKDALLLNRVLKPWNEVFEYGPGEIGYIEKEKAYMLNKEIMDWERKLIDFFEIKEEDAMKLIKYRQQKLKLALDTEDNIFEELKKVELIRPQK